MAVVILRMLNKNGGWNTRIQYCDNKTMIFFCVKVPESRQGTNTSIGNFLFVYMGCHCRLSPPLDQRRIERWRKSGLGTRLAQNLGDLLKIQCRLLLR